MPRMRHVVGVLAVFALLGAFWMFLGQGRSEPATAIPTRPPAHVPSAAPAPESTVHPIDIARELSPDTLRGVVRDATGGVVAGAEITITLDRRLPSWPPTYAIAADEDGAYALALPPTEFEVVANHPDYVPRSEHFPRTTGPQQWDVSLLPAASVEGTVRSAATGDPVRGAVVSNGSATALSGVDGRYALGGLPPGRLQLSAYAHGLASQFDVVVDLGIAEQRSGIDLELVAATDVSGRVVYASDETPVADATVELVDARGVSRSTTTDDAGDFTLVGLTDGSHTAAFSVEGCLDSILPLTSESSGIVVRMDCGVWIRGHVVPPMRARVTGRPPDTAPAGLLTARPIVGDQTAETDDEGAFVLGPFEAEQVTLRADADNGWEGVTIVNADAFDEQAEIRLEERYRITGVVIDADDEELARASVEVVPVVEGHDDAVDLRTVESTVTQADGSFMVHGLSPGRHQIIVLDAEHQQLGVVRPAGGELEMEARDLVGLRVTVDGNGESIDGHVSSTDGDIADVWVRATRRDQSVRYVRTGLNMSKRVSIGEAPSPVLADEEGYFQIEGLRPGEYRVEASRADGSAHGEVAAAETGDSIAIALEPAGRITGEVREDGRPVSPVRIDLVGPSKSTVLVSDEDGRFAWERLPPGGYEVFASRPADGTGPGETVVVDAGSETHVSIELMALTTLTGRLLDESGGPLRGATVVPRLRKQSRRYRPSSAITGPNGAFTLQTPPGVVHLTVYGHPLHLHLVTVSGETLDLGDLSPIPAELVIDAVSSP